MDFGVLASAWAFVVIWGVNLPMENLFVSSFLCNCAFQISKYMFSLKKKKSHTERDFIG